MVFVLIFTMLAMTGCGDKDKEADADAKETIIVGLTIHLRGLQR